MWQHDFEADRKTLWNRVRHEKSRYAKWSDPDVRILLNQPEIPPPRINAALLQPHSQQSRRKRRGEYRCTNWNYLCQVRKCANVVFVAMREENCGGRKAQQQLPVGQVFLHAGSVVVRKARTHVDPNRNAIQMKHSEVGTEPANASAESKIQLVGF